MQNNPFFTLLQIAVGSSKRFDTALSDATWEKVYHISRKHALAGVCFYAISLLPQEQYPKSEIIKKWIPYCGTLSRQNEILQKQSEELSNYFAQKGYRSLILKGQGNCMFYPNKDMRTPGDIDIWVDGDISELVSIARKADPKCRVFYHHVDFKTEISQSVEIHFRPSWMFNPFINRKLQNYYKSETDRQMNNCGQGSYAVPTQDFNLVYLLLHIYRHVFSEGIGLRQIVDYAFLLKSVNDREVRAKAVDLIHQFKLESFCKALMYVLKTVLNFDDSILLMEPSERKGKMLLSEIMEGGNFGKYNPVRKKKFNRSKLGLFLYHCFHNIEHFVFYPSEAFWGPAYRVWQYFWEKQWDRAKFT